MRTLNFLKSLMARQYILLGVTLVILSTPALAIGFKSLMKDMKATHQQANMLVAGSFSSQAAMTILKAYSDETAQAIGQMSNSAEGQDMKKRFTTILDIIGKTQSAPALDKITFAKAATQIETQCKSCHDAYN